MYKDVKLGYLLVQFREVPLTVVLFVSIRYIEHISCPTDCTVIVLSAVILPTFPAGLPLKAKKPDGTEWPAQSEIREISLSPGAHTSPFNI